MCRAKEECSKSAHEAVETLRAETKAIDQDLPPFVISEDGTTPVGPVRDGDAVIYFNFRGDRAIETARRSIRELNSLISTAAPSRMFFTPA